MSKPPHRIFAWIEAHKRALTVFLLLLIAAVGLYVRLSDFRYWKECPERYVHENKPLITGIDGYYYLRYARDLDEGTYEREDLLRAAPRSTIRPSIPPMLSCVTFAVKRLTGFELERIALFLPPLLAVTLAFPLYGIGRIMGGRSMGLSAALLGLLVFYYRKRTNVGFFDTDCLILTFMTAGPYFFLRFGKAVSRFQRYGYLAAGLIMFLLCVWWWDSATNVTTVMILTPLLFVILFHYRPPKMEALIFLGLLFAAAAVLTAFHYRSLIYSTKQMYDFLFGLKDSAFPSGNIHIDELEKVDFKLFVEWTTSNIALFLFSAAGLAWLFWRRRTEALILLPLVAAGSAVFFAGIRLLLFAAPVIALGFGFAVSRVWVLGRRRRIFMPVAVAVVLLGCVPLFTAYEKDRPPYIYIDGPLVSSMTAVSGLTPDNGIIWTRWDYGYPIAYWAERATVIDGGMQQGRNFHLSALPLVSADSRFSANFIRFYGRYGRDGIYTVYNAV